ncbi:exosortase V [Sphingomonas sp. HT-1]|uniref:exosortase V n=1 Tax=unclassified Sphingomonas TaxID=196159 RepID=UPI00037078DA|nr:MULTISPECIES: exosortase V [unclassified Sphingomonas]KTF67455.1 exosortase [Sphingomonas sp. WG]
MTATARTREQHKPGNGFWLAIAGLLALGIPTFITLGRQVWSSDGGVHGPIVLATGIWMLARQRDTLVRLRRPGNLLIGTLLLLLSLAVYTAGRVFDFVSIEATGLVATVITTGYLYFGGAALRAVWFPVLWLAFLIPPPGWMVDRVTAPLKEFVSYASTGFLSWLDYPILRQGVTLFIGPYQLLVEDACSGLRSLSSLVVVTLLYIYIKNKPSWGYALFIAMLVIPVAVATNILRIVMLVLITYHLGDAAAQSFLHVTTGMVMFVVALLCIFAIDWAVERLFLISRRRHVQPA